jgi:hypothetical protein
MRQPHPSTHPIAYNSFLENQTRIVMARWQMNPDELWSKDQIGHHLLAESRAAWNKLVSQMTMNLEHELFEVWSSNRDEKYPPPRMSFARVKPDQTEDLVDIIEGLSSHEAAILIKARADCLGFMADCKGRSRPNNTRGLKCLWHECMANNEYDTLSHALICTGPTSSFKQRSDLLTEYERTVGPEQFSLLMENEYALTAELLATDYEDIQKLMVSYLLELNLRRGFNA